MQNLCDMDLMNPIHKDKFQVLCYKFQPDFQVFVGVLFSPGFA